MRSSRRTYLFVGACVVVAVILLYGGFLLGADPGSRSGLSPILPAGIAQENGNTDFQLQNEILQKLESSYYVSVDPATLDTQAINGMVGALNDPYTVYFDPQEYASFQQQESGSYSGVGMEVEMQNRFVTVFSVFPGTPAQLAGIRAGDIIVAVNNTPVAGETLDDVVGKIVGANGTIVDLKIYRPPTPPGGTTTTTTTLPSATSSTQTAADASQLPPGGQTTSYSLQRKTIAVPVTDTQLLNANGKQVALIHFYTFSNGSAAALRAQVKKAVETDKVSAIILDLRGNGGGLLNEGIDVASIFIPSGVIVSTSGLHSPKQVYNATGGAYPTIPLYVLVDKYTASAAEIVSGALQDYKRATLIGETTFGKGLVQSIEPLSNGGALKVTTAVYLTPKGRNINKKGITPDVSAPENPNTPNVDQGVQAALKLIEAGSGGGGA